VTLGIQQGHPRVRFGKYLFGRPDFSDLLVVKGRDFFGETSPWTFITRGLIRTFLLFSEGQIHRLECKIRSASIFGGTSAARKFGG